MHFHLGIDLGSISLKVALLDESKEVCFERWVRVAGRPLDALAGLLRECAGRFPGASCMSAGVTGSGRGLVTNAMPAVSVNEISAHAAASSFLHPEIRTIIEIGGQDSKLIIFGQNDGAGAPTVDHFSLNELCAAGTGAFLDQQAARLGLSIEEFASLAKDSTDAVPIAGRCAVFAKTDMTHHQQEGRPLPDIVAGLNEALARSYLSNLVRGRKLPRPIAFQGGVAANAGLIAAFCKLLGLSEDELKVPRYYKVMGAIGAALTASGQPESNAMALSELAEKFRPIAAGKNAAPVSVGGRVRLKPPESAPLEPEFDQLGIDGNYLGIDVGSVSVKIAAIGPRGLAFSDYRFSEGRPLDVLQSIIVDMAKAHPGIRFDGVAATGSGRHFIGRLFCADVVQNEITSQARAAALLMPGCDTVVEIGGQDAKFMRLAGARPAHFAMNRVCAAGTGAFLQEQAARLEVDLEREFSDLAFRSERPAALGARCTVFMESDLVSQQQLGLARCDLVAGLSMSVVANYSEKVIAGHSIGENVLFLGGVAKNRAVVAALEAALSRRVRTSSVGNLSGAIGAAIAAMEARRRGSFSKSGFSIEAAAAMELSQDICEECPNRCMITSTNGESKQRFGGRCGRWDSDTQPKRRSATSLLKRRHELIFSQECRNESRITLARRRFSGGSHESRPLRIGIPRAMFAFDLFPAWRNYFEALGCEVVLSPPTDSEILSSGLGHLVVETCLPIKAFCSHLKWLESKGVDYIFVPSLVITGRDSHEKDTAHCPYVQGLYELARPIVSTPLLNPVINWKLDPRSEMREMAKLATTLGHTRRSGRSAWKKALVAQRGVREELLNIGSKVLSDLASGKIPRAFVILGKDYNVCDSRLSLGAAELFESRGEVVITQDMLVDDSGSYSPAYRTMFWSHGKEIVAGAEIAANTKNLFPVMITSFGCGPDSFTTGFIRDIMRSKPLLLIEVDEHSSSVGMETRVEAFLDSITDAPAVADRRRGALVLPLGMKRVYMPNFSPHGHAFAAAVRSLGLTPELTPLPDEESARLGALYCESGECHPYVLMLGDYLKVAMREKGNSGVCYYMPEAGTCRVAQFGAQMRLAAERAGVDLPIFTRVEDIMASSGKTPGWSYLKSLCAYWRMMRGMDFLMQMHLERRAYETEAGAADRAAAEGFELIERHILDNRPLEGLEAARDKLARVAIDRTRQRMRIGITGDYYTRVCDYANADLFRDIERMGGVVMLPPTMTEFVKYESRQRIGAAIRHGNIGNFAQAVVLRGLVDRLEGEVREIFKDDLDYEVPLDFKRAKRLLAPYMDMKLPAGLTGSVAAILEQLNAGANGIVSAITFHCTYGLVVGSVLARIDKEWPHVPKLTLIYEGLKPTHNRMRLEAFMERVRATNSKSQITISK